METLLDQIESWVTELLSFELPNGMFFHNQQHTRDVVTAVKSIGQESNLAEHEWEALLIAAWFHDTGYCYVYNGHEEQSVNVAVDFLHHQTDHTLRQQVKALILSTRMPQQPTNKLQAILCDADLYHLSQPDYWLYAESLRQEWAIQLHKTFSDEDWRRLNFEFLTSHCYFTPYARQYWEPLKEINLKKLRDGF